MDHNITRRTRRLATTALALGAAALLALTACAPPSASNNNNNGEPGADDSVFTVGVIASVSQPFCGTCTRARLSAEGPLYTCLFAVRGHDLRGPLRSGADDAALADRIAGVWTVRTDRYSELRSAATRDLPKVEMSHIGG